MHVVCIKYRTDAHCLYKWYTETCVRERECFSAYNTCDLMLVVNFTPIKFAINASPKLQAFRFKQPFLAHNRLLHGRREEILRRSNTQLGRACVRLWDVCTRVRRRISYMPHTRSYMPHTSVWRVSLSVVYVYSYKNASRLKLIQVVPDQQCCLQRNTCVCAVALTRAPDWCTQGRTGESLGTTRGESRVPQKEALLYCDPVDHRLP